MLAYVVVHMRAGFCLINEADAVCSQIFQHAYAGAHRHTCAYTRTRARRLRLRKEADARAERRAAQIDAAAAQVFGAHFD